MAERRSTAGPMALAPKHEGARDFRVLPMPAIDITWRDRVFLNTENGLGFYAADAIGTLRTVTVQSQRRLQAHWFRRWRNMYFHLHLVF